MKEELAKSIREALENCAAAVFLTGQNGTPAPHVARDAGDAAIDEVSAGDARYPMAAFALMVRPRAGETLAVVVRECDRRMFVELAKHGQVDLARIRFIGIPCSEELAQSCGCDHPCPPESVVRCTAAPAGAALPESEVPEDPAERLAYWMENLSRCIRCMGCRNVCPMCYCGECALDDPELVGTGTSPPDVPIFHLIRAVDMADHCVDCGMCEAVCPADIPLRQLYRLARGVVKDAFGYDPGVDPEARSPIEQLGEPADLAGMQEGFRSR